MATNWFTNLRSTFIFERLTFLKPERFENVNFVREMDIEKTCVPKISANITPHKMRVEFALRAAGNLTNVEDTPSEYKVAEK